MPKKTIEVDTDDMNDALREFLYDHDRKPSLPPAGPMTKETLCGEIDDFIDKMMGDPLLQIGMEEPELFPKMPKEDREFIAKRKKQLEALRKLRGMVCVG